MSHLPATKAQFAFPCRRHPHGLLAAWLSSLANSKRVSHHKDALRTHVPCSSCSANIASVIGCTVGRCLLSPAPSSGRCARGPGRRCWQSSAALPMHSSTRAPSWCGRQCAWDQAGTLQSTAWRSHHTCSHTLTFCTFCTLLGLVQIGP